MTWSNTMKHRLFLRLRSLVLGVSLSTILFARPVQAQADTGVEEIKPGAKGAVGTAFLGAELVLVVEAAIGVKPWWGYAIGGGAGAVAGAIGGHFIDKSAPPQVSMSLLVGGMVFAVPTAIAVLNATAYKVPKEPEADTALSRERQAKARERQAAELERQYYTSLHKPAPALVTLRDQGSFGMEMPAVEVRPVYSSVEQQEFSLPSSASVRVPVFSWAF